MEFAFLPHHFTAAAKTAVGGERIQELDFARITAPRNEEWTALSARMPCFQNAFKRGKLSDERNDN